MFEFIRHALSELAGEWRRRKALRDLDALNDHLLADIGLRRDQLPIFLLEARQRERPLPLAPVYHPELIACG